MLSVSNNVTELLEVRTSSKATHTHKHTPRNDTVEEALLPEQEGGQDY